MIEHIFKTMNFLHLFFSFYPIWLPIFLLSLLWKLWVHYVRAKYFLSEKMILLELKIPQEIKKTPLAMELFITTLYQTSGETTFIDRYILGKTRAWFSLELVSLEGKIKFFIWTRESWKNFIESQLYAQFPGIEVHVVPDYATPVHYDKEKMNVWGGDLRLTQPDPYPIKTYIDYGLDKPDLEEEGKADPMVNILEFLGSMTHGENIWIQIIIRAHKKERIKHGTFFHKVNWKDEAEREIEKIKHKAVDGGEGFSEYKLTSGDKEKIKAIERNVGKVPFDTGIRLVYMASREKYRRQNETALKTAFKQFNSPHLNGFETSHAFLPKFDYPWQDYRDRRKDHARHVLLEAYKRRSYFYPPYQSSKPFVLTTEELATIYHFPGKTAETPTFDRIVAKKAEPPANLPV